MNYIIKQSITAHAQDLIKYCLHKILAKYLEQFQLKDLTNIVKIQDVIQSSTCSKSMCVYL